MEPFVMILIGAAICGAIGMAIGQMGGRDNGFAGLVLGFLLGPIGLIVMAILVAGEKEGDAKPGQPETEKDRIARLEAELATLQGKAAAPVPTRAKDDLASDGEITTFKI
jgi:hypothetical protein